MPYQHFCSHRKGGVPSSISSILIFLSSFFVLFQNADERRGVLNRLSHFFSSKRKKSSSKRHSDSDTSVPSPPLSPCSLQSEEEEDRNTPTPSQKECNILVPHLATTDPEHFETLSQSSSHSTSSTVSIVTHNEISTNILPRTLDLTIKSCLDSSPGKRFPESRGQDKCQQSSVEVSTEDKIVNQTVLPEATVPLSKVIATPTVPKLPGSNASASKNTVNTGKNQDNFNPREAVLQFSALDLTQQVNKKCPDAQRENAGTNKRERSHSCEQECVPGTSSSLYPLQPHKAVKTYLREEDKNKEENLKSVTKDGQGDFQADMPLVLAIPVTVIPEDSDTQGTSDSPSDTLPSMDFLQLPGSSQNFHTSTLQVKHSSGEVCVTRKTVNLPSKHRVMPQKVRGNQVQSLAPEKLTQEGKRELPSKMQLQL